MEQDVARKKSMNIVAREAGNAYKREWFARNKEKQKVREKRYRERQSQSNRKKIEETGNEWV